MIWRLFMICGVLGISVTSLITTIISPALTLGIAKAGLTGTVDVGEHVLTGAGSVIGTAAGRLLGGTDASDAVDVDGDTIKLRVARTTGLTTIRLVGIDTPETHRPGTPIECGGPEASANMKHLLAKYTKLKLVRDPTTTRLDRYGRTLGYVDAPGQTSLEAAQLRAGWAMVYVYEGRPFTRLAAFKAAEADARTHHRGVWGLCDGDFHSAPDRR